MSLFRTGLFGNGVFGGRNYNPPVASSGSDDFLPSLLLPPPRIWRALPPKPVEVVPPRRGYEALLVLLLADEL